MQAQLTVAVDKLDQLQAELAQIQSQVAETRPVSRGRRRATSGSALSSESAPPRHSSPDRHRTSRSSLGATSMDDLSDRMAFVDAVTQSDAALAQQVANLKVVLQIEERALQDLEAKQQKQVDEQTALRDQILHNLSYISSLRDAAVALAQQTLEKYKTLDKQRQNFLEQQAQSTVSPPSPDVQLPPGFVNPLKVCPVLSAARVRRRVRRAPLHRDVPPSRRRRHPVGLRHEDPGAVRRDREAHLQHARGQRRSTSTRRTAPTSTTRTSRGTRRSPTAP